MKMKLIITLLAITTFAALANATTMVKLNVDSLSQQSNTVAVGQVVEMRSVMIHGEPWITATVLVEKSLKGYANGFLYLRIPGGVHPINGRLAMTKVEGTPDLHLTERGVFFLQGRAPQYMDLVGWNQGYWRVTNVAGKDYVTRSDESSPVISLDRLTQDVSKASSKFSK